MGCEVFISFFVRCFFETHKWWLVFYPQNPFLVISKMVESGIPIPVCKTEVLKNDHNPIWKPIFLNIQQVGSKVKGILHLSSECVLPSSNPESCCPVHPPEEKWNTHGKMTLCGLQSFGGYLCPRTTLLLWQFYFTCMTYSKTNFFAF